MQSFYDLYEKFKVSSGVCIDSRNMKDQCVFFCIKGDNFDGHEFAEDVLQKGALLVVIDNDEFYKADDERYFKVSDTLNALQILANHHRDSLNIPLIAITGTNGKTTTKELVHAVLSSRFNTHATKGNFNNHIGLPLTLLDMKDDIDVAVIEMGASAEKEIELLCQIAQPNYGLITNIGKAHLEGFGSLEGVKKAKGELFDYLRENNGKAFVNNDLNYLIEMSEGVYTINYGKDHLLHTYGKLTENLPYLRVLYDGDNIVNTKMPGDYNFYNIMAAICIGKYFNVPEDSIRRSLEDYEPNINRSQIVKYKGSRVLLDAYNANPSSMKVAIESFYSQSQKGSRILILGDMFELGKDSNSEHIKVLSLLKEKNVKNVALIGEEFKKASKEFDQFKYFVDYKMLKKWFDSNDWNGFDVFIKGSRAMSLEKLLT